MVQVAHIGRQRDLFVGLQTGKDVPAATYVSIQALEFEPNPRANSLSKMGMFGKRDKSLGMEQVEKFSEASIKFNLGIDGENHTFANQYQTT